VSYKDVTKRHDQSFCETGVCTAPFVGRLIDKMVPWTATLLATMTLVAFQAVLTGAAGINIGAVIVSCFGV
jgi:hypothetical protein